MDLGLHEPRLAEGDDAGGHERGGDEGQGQGRDPGGVAGADAADAHHLEGRGRSTAARPRSSCRSRAVSGSNRVMPDAWASAARPRRVVVEALQRLLGQAPHAGIEAGAEGQQSPDDGLRLVEDAELRADLLGQRRPVTLVERAGIALPVQHPDGLVDLGEGEHVTHLAPAGARVVRGHHREAGALELGLREREGRGGPEHLEHQGAPAQVREVRGWARPSS